MQNKLFPLDHHCRCHKPILSNALSNFQSYFQKVNMNVSIKNKNKYIYIHHLDNSKISKGIKNEIICSVELIKNYEQTQQSLEKVNMYVFMTSSCLYKELYVYRWELNMSLEFVCSILCIHSHVIFILEHGLCRLPWTYHDLILKCQKFCYSRREHIIMV